MYNVLAFYLLVNTVVISLKLLIMKVLCECASLNTLCPLQCPWQLIIYH
jgi:hypothetical protein